MAKDFLSRHPRFVYLMVGIVLLIGVSLGQYSLYDSVVEEKRVMVAELSKKLTERESTINTLTEAHQKLSKQVKTIRIVKPDGTIEEITESNTNSETQIRQQVKEEYKERIAEEINKVREEVSKITSLNQNMTVMVGIHSDMRRFIAGSYDIWGPLSINAGVVVGEDIRKVEYTIGVGWKF